MGYEKPSTKLTFYKAFFSPQWKFLIHTILQCMSAKRTSWNEFSSSMASAVICLSTGRKFNFSKYIFDSLVRNVDSSTKFNMYLRFLQLMIRAQVGDLSSHSTKYSSHFLTQKVFANMRRVGKDFSGVDIPLFEDMLVAQQVDKSTGEVNVDDVPAASVANEGVADVNVDFVLTIVDEPSIPSPTPPTQPQPPSQDLPSTSQETCTTLTIRVEHLEHDKIAQALEMTKLKQMRRIIASMDADVDVTLKDVADIAKELACYNYCCCPNTYTAAALTLTTAPSAARKRKGVVIRDLEETATPSTIIHTEPKSKDKGKGILVEEPKSLKKKTQIEQDEAYAIELKAELNKNIDWDEPQTKAQARKNMMIYLRNMDGFKMDYFKGMTYDDICPILEKKFNSNVAFLEKTKEQMEEEDSKALKKIRESQEDKAAKKQKLDKEVKELRKHLR
nr:hypothetical protein [Tanacetum cinerariifolium]